MTAATRIDLDAIREVRPWFHDFTDRELDAKLRLIASALLAAKLNLAFPPMLTPCHECVAGVHNHGGADGECMFCPCVVTS